MKFQSDNALDTSNYLVERFEYNMEEEIAKFHALFAKWSVGNVEHVYYIPDFVTEEEEQALLSKVRIEKHIQNRLLLNLSADNQF